MTDTTATLSYDHDLGELPSVAAGRADGSVASDELRDTLEDPLAVQMSADHARALDRPRPPCHSLRRRCAPFCTSPSPPSSLASRRDGGG